MDFHSLLAQVSGVLPGEIYAPQLDAISRLGDLFKYEFANYTNIFTFLKGFHHVWLYFSLPISVFCVVGTVIAVDGLARVRRAERHKYHYRNVVEADEDQVKGNSELTERWRHILDRSESSNESDWRQAIIDADSILEEILRTMGYQGAGIGEMLRRVEKGDMKTLDQAGEAHGVRNRIAHDGSAFVMSHHEAKRVINLYRQVFEEFYYI